MNILEKANSLVNGERQTDYDDPVKNFKLIARIASLCSGKELTPTDCCNVMIAVKLAREAFKEKEDNRIDLAGYILISDKIKKENDA